MIKLRKWIKMKYAIAYRHELNKYDLETNIVMLLKWKEKVGPIKRK